MTSLAIYLELKKNLVSTTDRAGDSVDKHYS